MKRSSIQSLIRNAIRPALQAVSRWAAVILLSARKLAAPAGISSISGAWRNAAGTASARARARVVCGAGCCRPLS